LNKILFEKFHTSALIRSVMNYQVNFDLNKITDKNLDFDAIKRTVVDFLQQQPGISFAADMSVIGRYPIPRQLHEMMINGY